MEEREEEDEDLDLDLLDFLDFFLFCFLDFFSSLETFFKGTTAKLTEPKVPPKGLRDPNIPAGIV